MNSLLAFIANQFKTNASVEKPKKNNVVEHAKGVCQERLKLNANVNQLFVDKNPDLNTIITQVSNLKQNNATLIKEMKSIEKKIHSIWTFFSPTRKSQLKEAREDLKALSQIPNPDLNDKAQQKIKKSLDSGTLFEDLPSETIYGVLTKARDCREIIKSDKQYVEKFDVALFEYLAKQKKPSSYLNFISNDIIFPGNISDKITELLNCKEEISNLLEKPALKYELKSMYLENDDGINTINLQIEQSQTKADILIKEIAKSSKKVKLEENGFQPLEKNLSPPTQLREILRETLNTQLIQDMEEILTERDNLLDRLPTIYKKLNDLSQQKLDSEIHLRKFIDQIGVEMHGYYPNLIKQLEAIYINKNTEINQSIEYLADVINLEAKNYIEKYLRTKNLSWKLNLNEEAINQRVTYIQKNGVVKGKIYI